MAGRPTPTAVLEARNSPSLNMPSRARSDEPDGGDPLGLEDWPDHFKGPEKKAWRHLIKCAPEGVLTQSDQPTVELAAVLFAEFRTEYEYMKDARLKQLQSILGAMGMNPSDRARMGVGKPKKKENEFGKLLNMNRDAG